MQVVAQLKASCERLPEEQLAKLGVVLLNCQAETEGRRTYLCTEQMVKDIYIYHCILKSTFVLDLCGAL